jgi:hypothetical protein
MPSWPTTITRQGMRLDHAAFNGQAHRMRLSEFTLAIAALPGFALCADFELAGIRGGMTDAQVRAAAPSGFEYWRIGDGPTLLLQDSEVYASVAFCHGRVMAVRRTIDADADWLPALETATRERGQPQVITTTTPWSGPGGATSRASFYAGRKPALSSTFQSRRNGVTARAAFVKTVPRRFHSWT